MRILTEKKLSLDILDTQTNIGSWVKGHSLGYSIKKKKRKEKSKKNHSIPLFMLAFDFRE